MTRTTTGSSRLTVILSWMIALICFVGGALYILKMPSPDQEAMDLQMKQQKNQKSRKSLTEKVKQEQAQRALPAEVAHSPSLDCILINSSKLGIRELPAFKELYTSGNDCPLDKDCLAALTAKWFCWISAS